MVRSWYVVINWFPSIAAVSCWLSIVMPNVGILFQVVYECFEALALTRFCFIVLTLLNGGVSALDGYISSKGSTYNAALFPSVYVVLRDTSKIPWTLVSPPLSIFYPELRDDDDITRDVAAGGYRKPHKAGRLFLALYQFVVLAPVCAFMQAVSVYAWKQPWADPMSTVFEYLKVVSTVTAVATLVLTLIRVYGDLPAASRIHVKFVSIKVVVLLGTFQGTLIALIISCGGSHTKEFPVAVAASVWQSMIFLMELPFLHMFMIAAYPAADLPALFGFDSELGSYNALAENK